MTRDRLGAFVRQLHHLTAGPAQAESSDGQLLDRFARAGDEAAFAALMRRHGGMVLRVCRRLLRHEMDVEDTFQATFLLLVRRAASIRKRESIGSWLHGVAYRLAMHTRADAARRRMKEQAAPKPTVAEPGFVAAWRELQDVLDEELQRLPERYRLPLVLCYLEGETHEDVAARLSWPLGTVKGRLSRARELLRTRLARRGLTLGSGPFAAVLAAYTANAAAPASLAAATCQSALGLLSGNPAIVPVRVASLAEGVARIWYFAKLKIVMVLGMGLLATGGGLVYLSFPHGNSNGKVEFHVPSPTAKADRNPSRVIQASTDLHGDPLPRDATARLGTTRLRAGRALFTFAFSPDGKWVAAPGESAVFVWDAVTGKEVYAFTGHRGRVFPVAFSNDGQRLATGGADHSIRLWKLSTGEEVACLEGHTGPVGGLVFSEDGTNIVSGSMDKFLRFWDIKTGAERLRLGTEAGTPLANVHFPRALSTDGRTLVTEDDQYLIHVWDVEKRAEVRCLSKVAGPRDRVAVSSAGEMIAASARGKSDVQIWDVATGELIATCRGHQGEVPSLAFSKDGKTLATASTDRTIRLWDVRSGSEVRQFDADHGQTEGLAFSPDGHTLASGQDGTIRLWDTTSGKEKQPFAGHRGAVRFVGFSPDGAALISSSRDNTVRTWDVATGQMVNHWRGDSRGDATLIAASVDGRSVACGGNRDAVLCVRDARTGREMRRWQAHRPAQSAAEAVSMAFSHNGKTIFTGGSDRKVAEWSVATGGMLRRFESEMTEVDALAFSPVGKLVAAGCRDGTLHLWDSTSGKLRQKVEAARDPIRCLSFSPDGHSLACATGRHFAGGTGIIMLFDVATGTLTLTLQGHQVRTHCIAFSPDGKTLASGGADCTVRLWDLDTGAEAVALDGHGGAVTTLAFSPDGKRLATGSADTAILIWSLDRVNSHRVLPRSSDRVQSINGVFKKG